MIKASVKMGFAPEKENEVLQILKSVAARTRAQTGCLNCSVYQDAEEEHTIIFEEEWENEKEMERHIRSREYQKLLLIMEMAINPPEIKFNTVSNTSGIEIIEKAMIGDAKR